MSTKEQALRKKLVRMAHQNKEVRARVLPLIQAPTNRGRLLTARQRRDLVEAIRLAKTPEYTLKKLPGFSPMQLRQHIDRIADVRQELDIMATEYEYVLKKMKDLEKEEKEGLKKLKKAGEQLREKGRICVETEKALLNFTAYTQEKRPGIDQMLEHPEDSKWGEKAGDLFGRIAKKLGGEIAEQVEQIYEQCKEDLTHTANVAGRLKIVAKTSSLPPEVVKTAGLADTIVSIKEWLAGGTSSMIKKVIGFVGDIGRWVKGFVVRTKMVKKASTDLKKALTDAEGSVDKMLAGAES